MEEVNLNQAIPEINPEITTKVNEEDDNGSPEESSIFRKVIDFYSANLTLPSPYELEIITGLCDEFKNSELIIFAIKQSIHSNARNLRYVEKVLYGWKDKGIKTVEEAEIAVKEYKKYKGDRENGRCEGISWKNKYNNSKDASKSEGKWSGYKPPKPECTGNFDYEGLI